MDSFFPSPSGRGFYHRARGFFRCLETFIPALSRREVVLAFNFFGDAIRDACDPRRRNSKALI
jgi:hypothetical protein